MVERARRAIEAAGREDRRIGFVTPVTPERARAVAEVVRRVRRRR